jgi:putative ABC transport system permease protein
MTMLKQIIVLTSMSLKGIPQRPLSTLVTVIGVATMVAVMTALLALGAGLTASTVGKVGPDMVIVVARGGASDYMGSISREAVNLITEAPGVKTNSRGKAQVLPAVSLSVNVTRKDTKETATISLVSAPVDVVGSVGGIRLTTGRFYRPGLRELVVGRVASKQYENLRVGDQISLRGSRWAVVGEFESGGGASENELYGEADTVMSAFDRNAYQNIEVRLDSPADFAKFKSAVESDPRLDLDVKPLRQYLQDQLSQLTSVINFVGYFVGTVMALGAFFGILNTMYAAIDARRREFATLRAVGFSRLGILVSITLESLVLALPGALIGVAIAWLMFSGHLGQVGNFAFPIAFTPGIALIGIVFTVVIGLIGGLVPSIMAARLPIATALRST